MAKRRIIKEKPSVTKLLDVRLVIQVGMILFAIVGFYFTTKQRLDMVEGSLTEIKSSLTDSRMVKVEMKLEEIEKELRRLNMHLISLEDFIDEEVLGNMMQQK